MKIDTMTLDMLRGSPRDLMDLKNEGENNGNTSIQI
jgi:hypothetical protein